MSFDLEKFMEKTLTKENEQKSKQVEEENPSRTYRKKYAELPQNRIKYGGEKNNEK